MSTTRTKTLLATLTCLALAAACGGPGGESGGDAAAPSPGGSASAGTGREVPDGADVYTVRGVYLRPVFDGEAMQVDHEAIPGYMAAMSMAFRLADPSALEGLEEGDKIRFRYVVAGVESFADRVETLPDDTELELADEGS